MSKMLVVLNNLEIGGIQKAALGYVGELAKENDVTLLVLSLQGPLIPWIPSNVHLAESGSLYHYFGMAQRDCKSLKDKLLRSILAVAARIFGTDSVRRIADLTIDAYGSFDRIVSYHHPGRDKSIYAGTAEYALAYARRHPAETECFVHCDYCLSGICTPRSKRLYSEFTRIICVSNGTKESFLCAFSDEPEQTRAQIEKKTLVQYNTVDSVMILCQAEEGGVPECMNRGDCQLTLLSVARVSEEKGILRFAKLLAEVDHSAVRYVIVGDGPDVVLLKALISEKHLEDTIILAGAKTNPYPYMKHADILVVPSYHEGAPVVYQEAEVLGLPVFTTDTRSAREMVKNGWVVENNDAAIQRKLREVIEQWSR